MLTSKIFDVLSEGFLTVVSSCSFDKLLITVLMYLRWRLRSEDAYPLMRTWLVPWIACTEVGRVNKRRGNNKNWKFLYFVKTFL